MRFILFLTLVFGCITVDLSGQNYISLQNCTWKQELYNTPGNIPFYAIKDADNTQSGGQISFRPGGSEHWNFSWTINGVPQPADYIDSINFVVSVAGDGVYAFRAEKNGIIHESGEFRIFYVYVPAFSVDLSDEDDCEEVKLSIPDFRPASYNDNGTPYYGGKNVYYLLSGKTAPWTFPSYQGPEWKIPIDVRDVHTNKNYFITITDKFGFEWKSKEIEYESVIPEAKFSVNPDKGEAPLKVDFRNESVNAQQYEWFLYKDSTRMPQNLSVVEDSLLDEMVRREKSFQYTYQHPGSYNVKLIAYNTVGINQCSDTMSLEKYITVDSSLVDVPNVFTPNGDGKNDIFKVKAASLQSFHAIIINRWGRKVYEWSDPAGGWDGKINGKYANPGTYYYIITAKGWEIEAKTYVKKGPLLLVR